MSFSERMKLVPVKQIQKDNIGSVLKHRITNLIEETFDDNQSKFILDIMGYRTISDKNIFTIPVSHGGKNFDKLIATLQNLPWNNLYDIIEYGYSFLKTNCEDCTSNCDATYDEANDEFYPCDYKLQMIEYSESFNCILEQEKSGYRLIDGVISPIIGEIEIACIEEASNTPFSSVNTHLQKALQLYSDRENPDYENSIKESISAVESMCCIITGLSGTQATLGNALKHLEDRGLILHGALKSAFEKMYGYASDTNGIRHGGIDFKNAPAEDAKYMLISCSAFTNYLIEKYSKIGGTP